MTARLAALLDRAFPGMGMRPAGLTALSAACLLAYSTLSRKRWMPESVLEAMATVSGGAGIELLTVLRIQLTHLGAQVVGRTLAGNQARPAKDSSIQELLKRLLQMSPLSL